MNGTARAIDRPNKYRDLGFARPVILKLHGTVDRDNIDGDGFVVTEDHFVDYLSGADLSSLLPVTLAARLRKSHFLFVGYRLRDWNVRAILRRIWGERQLSYNSWAIQPAAEPLERELWRVRDVELLDTRLDEYLSVISDQLGALQALDPAHDS
jgi:hypothetical protein